MDDEGFYDALVRMFEQALKYVLALPEGQPASFLGRLDRVRQLGQNVGWGVGDDFDHFWAQAGLVGEA
jgi:phage-related protein